ncbi:MAG: hypothetical protein R3F61_05355 [Myxococcota bacterium]
MWMWMWLAGCTRVHGGGLGETDDTDIDSDVVDDRVWVQLNAHPCALADNGEVQCWRSAEWEPMIESGTMKAWTGTTSEPISEITAEIGPYFWGLSRETGLPVMIYSPSDLRPDSVAGYSEIGTLCALLNGKVDCIDSYDNEDWDHLDLTLLSGMGPMHAGLTTDNRLIGMAWPDIVLEDPIDGVVVDVMAFQTQNRCALLDTGEVQCFGPIPVVFPNPPYYAIAGGYWVGCAARDPGLVDCSNGETYDFGERLLDMTATNWTRYVPNEPGSLYDWGAILPTASDPPHICVLTESNAIRCQGWRYEFDDLQRALPKGFAD